MKKDRDIAIDLENIVLVLIGARSNQLLQYVRPASGYYPLA